jgi:drug/metabolite transporter (DMT)-like permease
VTQVVLALRSPFVLLFRLSLAAKVAVALGTVYLVWGSTLFATQVALATIPPFTLQAARFLLAGALLFVVAERLGDRNGDRPTLRQWWQALLTGNLLMVGGTGFITLAQTRIPSGTAGLLLATVPIWLALLARGIFGERLSPRAWLGLLVGLVGVGLLMDPSGGGHLGGMFLALLGAFAWAAGSLRSRVNDAPSRPLVAAAMQMLCGGAGFLVVAAARGELLAVDVGALGASSLLSFLYLLSAGSLVAFTAYSWLLRNVSTTLVGTYAYVNPTIAVLLGWLFAGESYTGATLVAGSVVLVAVVLIVTGRPGEPIPAQATSGGDVFAGQRRWHTVRRQLGRLPAAARLYRAPGAPQYRDVGYAQPVASTVMESDEIDDIEAELAQASREAADVHATDGPAEVRPPTPAVVEPGVTPSEAGAADHVEVEPAVTGRRRAHLAIRRPGRRRRTPATRRAARRPPGAVAVARARRPRRRSERA